MIEVGNEIEVSVERVAHGGHCVGRFEGQVVFVRHTLPDEGVRVRVTKRGRKGRFWFGDAVEVLEAAPDRVPPRCSVSGPGGCGGCDWQHVSMSGQRMLKTAVVREQMERLGGFEWDGEVEAAAVSETGLDWRTRVRYAISEAAEVGFRAHHSHDVIPVAACPIATPAVRGAKAAVESGEDVLVTGQLWPESREVIVVGPSGGDSVVSPVPGPAMEVTEASAGREFRVPADGFWQVHPKAADLLASVVVEGIPPEARVWDLYAGVGLFAGALRAGGHAGPMTCVEGAGDAIACAMLNLFDDNVEVVRAEVGAWLAGAASDAGGSVDAVILDPPRTGVGREIVESLTRSSASWLVYVACDPAALGRDLRTALAADWELESLRAFDLFPMTQHIESVAVLRR